VWLVNCQHALDRGNHHLRGWHAVGGNITSDLSQCVGEDLAGWLAAMCMHLLTQWRCADRNFESASVRNFHQ